MNGVISFSLFVFILFLSQENFAQSTKVAIPTYDEFESKIHLYPYHAKPERSGKIISGLASLKVCMNKMQIHPLLGKPDYTRINYGPKGPGEKLLGSSWMYYLSKKSDLVNINDSTVEVFFDTNDRAYWVIPHHIDGALEIGGVREKCL
jgi:hypothetical protein